MTQQINEEIRKVLASIKNKRAAIVINHILENGQITTEELSKIGYNHPPRAARDVREAGIPLVTIRVKSSDGRTIGAYKFGDFSEIRAGRLAGRVTFPKSLQNTLYKLHNGRCTICGAEYEKRYLQVDHRVPYEVAGDEVNSNLDPDKFMMLCGSCNRAKSWSCEHCNNWMQAKEIAICTGCYWANPQQYTHIATIPERRMEIVWVKDEVAEYDWVVRAANAEGIRPHQFVKNMIRNNKLGK